MSMFYSSIVTSCNFVFLTVLTSHSRHEQIVASGDLRTRALKPYVVVGAGAVVEAWRPVGEQTRRALVDLCSTP